MCPCSEDSRNRFAYVYVHIEVIPPNANETSNDCENDDAFGFAASGNCNEEKENKINLLHKFYQFKMTLIYLHNCLHSDYC